MNLTYSTAHIYVCNLNKQDESRHELIPNIFNCIQHDLKLSGDVGNNTKYKGLLAGEVIKKKMAHWGQKEMQAFCYIKIMPGPYHVLWMLYVETIICLVWTQLLPFVTPPMKSLLLSSSLKALVRIQMMPPTHVLSSAKREKVNSLVWRTIYIHHRSCHCQGRRRWYTCVYSYKKESCCCRGSCQ